MLISGLSQVTGQTYSSFNDTETISGEVKTCEVFPNTIKASFENLLQRFQYLDEMSSQFFHYEKTEYAFQKIKQPAENATPEELVELADQLSLQIDSYTIKVNKLNEQQTNYKKTKTLVLEELMEIKKILIQLKDYQQFNSKCTTFSQTSLKEELMQTLQKNKLLSKDYRIAIIQLLNEFTSPRSINTANSSEHTYDIEQGVEKQMIELIDEIQKDQDLLSSRIDEIRNLETELRKKANKTQKEIDKEKEKATEEAAMKEKEKTKAAKEKEEAKGKSNDQAKKNEEQKDNQTDNSKVEAGDVDKTPPTTKSLNDKAKEDSEIPSQKTSSPHKQEPEIVQPEELPADNLQGTAESEVQEPLSSTNDSETP